MEVQYVRALSRITSYNVCYTKLLRVVTVDTETVENKPLNQTNQKSYNFV